jgi:acetyl-CoA synthetase
MADTVIEVKPEWREKAYAGPNEYERLYERSVNDPEGFWGEHAERIQWHKRWLKVKNTSFYHPVSIRWFEGGVLNACENCVDRHAARTPDSPAIIWEPEALDQPTLTITYRDLLGRVSRFANGLKSLGVKKGDRVTIYLPMIPEAAVAMLACARIGAVHSVVFGGFAPDSLAGRMNDGQSTVLITADEGIRGGKPVALKHNADMAAEKVPSLNHVIVVRHTGAKIEFKQGRDIWWHELEEAQSSECAVEPMDAEDPLFMLYTSGSTNKPKGVLHTTGGYLVYAAVTHQYVFDYRPGEIYWCAADVGWITGHTYMIYGPLANGATTVMYEGLPTYPTPARIWQIVDKLKVHILYTAPTLIRSLIQQGEKHVDSTSRKTLRILGSVGEPINPEAWLWYYRKAGDERCPIVDTYWQTETGGIVISPLPGATRLKPGSATRPFFGIKPALLTDKGDLIEGAGKGVLCFTDSWPGQMRTVYGDHERFFQTYFSQYPGRYFTGDGAKRDEDGYYWISGRVDDVINISGHRLGTAEVESALVLHPKVAEAAAVGYPHDIKGQGLYCFVTLKAGIAASTDLRDELIQHVRAEIGPFARPDLLQFTPGLPKTRSGKIMRRILRKIAENNFADLGDISTLAEPGVVKDIIDHRLNQ